MTHFALLIVFSLAAFGLVTALALAGLSKHRRLQALTGVRRERLERAD